jgi:hypothetical protein
MEEMGAVSSKNLAASRQTTQEINRLATTSDELAASVEAFKLDEEIQDWPQSKNQRQEIETITLKEADRIQERSEASLLDLV